ncbi:MAG: GTPase [Elainellaceae cyanobacterium]
MGNPLLPPYAAAIDHRFVLLAHVICADQQIHSRELRALKNLAQQLNANEATLQAIEKILEQGETQISIWSAAQAIPVGRRDEALRQAMAIAYSDGYFAPLEREFIDRLAQFWGLHSVEHILKVAQGFGVQPHNDSHDALSAGARLLKGTETLFSKSLVDVLTDLAPQPVAQRIEQLHREILLSGPQYDEAIQRCAEIAREDITYAERALEQTSRSLKTLETCIQHIVGSIGETIAEQDSRQAAKEVAKQLDQTAQGLSSQVLRDLECVHAALQAKRRSLSHFTIAVMGRTKAGKSTLHAVVTGEGWEAIGIGKQRTTRYNRVYEWKNIRIIDTPGIGAPGGKTDEEIASSVIEEADVICYVVTDDSIQETEFAFLKLLKERTKPLVVLLNVQYNLRDSRRLEHFLKNPGRWFAPDGRSGLGGHLNRIHRYAQEHYPNDYMTVIPVMLLGAQMAQEPEHKAQAKRLFQASRVQDFLDAIRLSLVDHGIIRRSQTLLGSTVGSIDASQQWVTQQAASYHDLAKQLREQRANLQRQIQGAQQDSQQLLHHQVREVFQSAFDQVAPFAEAHWKHDEGGMKSSWSHILKNIRFEERLQAANDYSREAFKEAVQEAIDELGREIELVGNLNSCSLQFSTQNTSFLDKDLVRIAGMTLVAAGAILAFVFPPLGLLGFVGGVVSWFASGFKSRDQKRREAVQQISGSLYHQLDEQQDAALEQVAREFETYCQSVAEAVDSYFEELIKGLEAIAEALDTAHRQLGAAANGLNRAYAKRIVDWAADQYEPLTDTAISRKIHSVDRNFGCSMQIQTTTPLPLAKTPEAICQVLQEQVSIQPK